jgi:hypothetical protein
VQGPSALTLDLVNVVRRIKLLGFNGVRLPFSFTGVVKTHVHARRLASAHRMLAQTLLDTQCMTRNSLIAVKAASWGYTLVISNPRTRANPLFRCSPRLQIWTALQWTARSRAPTYSRATCAPTHATPPPASRQVRPSTSALLNTTATMLGACAASGSRFSAEIQLCHWSAVSIYSPDSNKV